MHHEMTTTVSSGLAVFYVLAAALNAGCAYYYVKQRNRPQALLWLLAAGVLSVDEVRAMRGLGAVVAG